MSAVVIDANVRTVSTFDFTTADADAAVQMGIVLAGPMADRISRAVYAYNMAAKLAVEAGYLLLSVKAELPHGAFEEKVDALGLSRFRSAELMRMAKFATALPEAERAKLLQLPKTKVLALASADPEVIQDLLENGTDDLADLSVRDLRQHIRRLQAQAADAAVQRDTVAAERDGLARQLRKRRLDDEDHAGVPRVVADARAEAAALVKKAELAISDLYPLGVEVTGLSGHEQAGVWVAPTLRLALSGAVALRLQLDGLIGSYAQALEGALGGGAGQVTQALAQPAEALAALSDDEVKAVAEEWQHLVALHRHEAALRVHERDQTRPKGKGRPKQAPVAPQV